MSKFSYKSVPILTLYHEHEMGLLNSKPNFQRNYIWKNEFKDELITSIVSKYPIGNLIMDHSEKILKQHETWKIWLMVNKDLQQQSIL